MHRSILHTSLRLAPAGLLIAACTGGVGKPFFEGPGPKDESRIGGLLGGGEGELPPEGPGSVGATTTTGAGGAGTTTTTTTGSTMTGGGSSSGVCNLSAADACGACILDNCPMDAEICEMSADCCCWADCYANDPQSCQDVCPSQPPNEFNAILECASTVCSVECGAGA